MMASEHHAVHGELLAVIREEMHALSAQIREDVRAEMSCTFKEHSPEGKQTVSSSQSPGKASQEHKEYETKPQTPVGASPPPPPLPGQLQIEPLGSTCSDDLPATDDDDEPTPGGRNTISRMNTAGSSRIRCSKPGLQKAMGFVPNMGETGEALNERGVAKRAEQIVKSQWFELASMALILGNIIQVGAVTDHHASNVTADTPWLYRLLDVIFFACFVVEISFRLVAYHRHFFTVFGWFWNAFDLGLVILQIVEEIIALISHAGVPSLFVLRVVRIIRIIRMVRIVRISRLSNDLRLLSSCICYCFGTFFWSASFVGLLIYIVGIYFTDLVLDARLAWRAEMIEGVTDTIFADAALAEHFGSLTATWYSLFKGLTGGMDWGDMAEPLKDVSPGLLVVLVCFISFTTIAVLNLVTGMFCQVAMERADSIADLRKRAELVQIFRSVDLDVSGELTREELYIHINNHTLTDFLNRMKLETDDLELLFDTLDHSESGTISSEEFVDGILELEGPANSMDVLLLRSDIKKLIRDFRNLNREIKLSRPSGS
eukprot:TRINITY_DN18301_c0_g1_i1.p1 TRINITY_DN18301_c0_g1~~TRINITY_DN18301_c0_g1_i1.p1  ORF type:complete len:545 (-),score=81.02 TRINITY_DN18301_c0_g1_i1:224-1858(-)